MPTQTAPSERPDRSWQSVATRESWRIGLQLVLMLALVGGAVNLAVSGTFGQERVLIALALLGLVGTVYESVLLLVLRRRVRRNRPFPHWVWSVNMVLEVLAVTFAMTQVVESGSWRPYEALVSPFALLFLVVVGLATLQRRASHVVLSGLCAAVGYLLATAYVYWQFPGLALASDPGIATFLGYALVLAGSGVLAARVTNRRTAAQIAE